MQLDEWLDAKAEGIARHIQADSAVYLWQMAAICVAITLICITAPVRTGSLTEIISLWSEMLAPHGVTPARRLRDEEARELML